jgi:DNA-binding NarL/FixJ family response regulator
MELRCLLVDDSPGFLEAARTRLEREGVRIVATASTHAEALSCASQYRHDVAIVDVDLGEDDGFAVVRELAARGDTPTLILTSANDERHFADDLRASPAAGFVAKADLSREAISAVMRGAP